MRYITVATGLSLAFAAPAVSQELSSADLPKMEETYRQNEARFKQEFVGRQFVAQLPLRGVVESTMKNGFFHLRFGNMDASFSEVVCRVSDKALIAEAAKWNKGDVIAVSGMVGWDYMPGMTFLEGCTAKKV
jgi:hypothetical protein